MKLQNEFKRAFSNAYLERYLISKKNDMKKKKYFLCLNSKQNNNIVWISEFCNHEFFKNNASKANIKENIFLRFVENQLSKYLEGKITTFSLSIIVRVFLSEVSFYFETTESKYFFHACLRLVLKRNYIIIDILRINK